VAAVIWLHPAEQAPPAAGQNRGDALTALPGIPQPAGDLSAIQLRLTEGFSLTMIPVKLVDGQLGGYSAKLGDCLFPVAAVRELALGSPAQRQQIASYDEWVTRQAKEPDWDIPSSDGGNAAGSALIGKTADDFELPMLDGTTFRLRDHADKVVILDFWATWCGPCIRALPDYIAATSRFDSSQVIFVAVNLQEASDQVREFLAERELSPRVALDRSGEVARKFEVSGIPHTVTIGRGNVIEDVHVGYQATGGELLQSAVQQLLDGTWQRPVPADGSSPKKPTLEKPTP
jgi:thiol-disulfide isomerase/thioredoxin